jgi:hypothetical protein
MITPLPLGFGWDRLAGWKDQFDRLQRWYERLFSAEGSTHVDSGWSYDFWDFAFAFFQNAYHLKDWIKLDHPELKDVVESYITDHIELQYCADICNGTKHMQVTKNPRLPGHLTGIREYAPYEATGQRLHVLGPFGPMPVLDLARGCVSLWEKFIKNHLSNSNS